MWESFVAHVDHQTRPVQERKKVRAIERQREFDFRNAIRQQIRHPMEQLLQAFPGADGNKDSIREMKPQGVQCRLVFHQVDLVQNGNHPLRVSTQFPQHPHRRLIKIEYSRMTGVEDVDQEIRKHSLFECGFKCFDQAMGQIPHKPHRVGQEQTLAGREKHPTSRGIEGCE